jgi:hypothetical protein
MMKYKVGDKVRVRKDISVKGNWGFVEEMKQFIGKVVTISRLVDTDDDEYLILEDGGEYVWTNEIFEGLVNDAPSIAKRINEKHNILNGLTNTDAIKPDYYKYRGGDVFDMAKHFELDYPLGSALKYLLRAGHKDPAKKVEDLNKCIECIKRHIELEG